MLLAAVLIGSLYACQSVRPIPQTSAAPAHPDSAPQAPQEPPRWTYLRFRLARNDDGAVDSYLDAMIADQVLAGPIAREGHRIPLWRFHRRWPDDATGHQFSLILFAPSEVAQRLIEQVLADPLLDELQEDGHLTEIRVDHPDQRRGADMAATSDPSWPAAIQREWPKFIMGASRMWLGLVQSEASQHPELALHARYQAVETALDRLWFKQANHAFFHHLSALFGYKPMRVIRRDIMTF